MLGEKLVPSPTTGSHNREAYCGGGNLPKMIIWRLGKGGVWFRAPIFCAPDMAVSESGANKRKMGVVGGSSGRCWMSPAGEMVRL
jgi:hypothetical protein